MSRIHCTCAGRFAFVPLLRTGGDCLRCVRSVRSIREGNSLQPTVEILRVSIASVSITENDLLKSRLRNCIFRNAKAHKKFFTRANAWRAYVANDFF